MTPILRSLMRREIVILNGFWFALLSIGCTNEVNVEKPTEIATQFLQAVRRGDASEAKKTFEDQGWRVPPLEGDEAYFLYESGHQPNLAFLLGKSFEFEILDVHGRRPSDSLPIVGTRLADLKIRLSFNDDVYSPYLLPLPMAFGQTMSQEEFLAFVEDPTRYGPTALSLRLRPTIEPGLIRPPEVQHLEIPPPPVQPGQIRETRSSIRVPRLEDSLRWGQIPKDAGEVLLSTGERITSNHVREVLPRLREIEILIRLQKASWYQKWGVHSFYFGNASVETESALHRIPTGKR